VFSPVVDFANKLKRKTRKVRAFNCLSLDAIYDLRFALPNHLGVTPNNPCRHDLIRMEESVMSGIPDELIVGLPSLTLTAKGAPALWLVVPVSAILIALAWRIIVFRKSK
jgi:hypothetical protein